MNKADYKIPSESIEHTYEIKKSEFIARAHYVQNRQQAMDFLAQARKDYPDARHHCWAYQLGNPNSPSNAAFNDDGEPSGTAGKPILNVLSHKDIGDIMVIVIRYFGGIKLGAGGLVRAYSTATQQAVELLKTELQIAKESVTFIASYADEKDIRHFCQQHEADVLSVEYGTHIEIRCAFPLQAVETIQNFVDGRIDITLKTD